MSSKSSGAAPRSLTTVGSFQVSVIAGSPVGAGWSGISGEPALADGSAGAAHRLGTPSSASSSEQCPGVCPGVAITRGWPGPQRVPRRHTPSPTSTLMRRTLTADTALRAGPTALAETPRAAVEAVLGAARGEHRCWPPGTAGHRWCGCYGRRPDQRVDAAAPSSSSRSPPIANSAVISRLRVTLPIRAPSPL